MGTPFWINPCNVDENHQDISNEIDDEIKLPEAELANNILSQANVALSTAYHIKAPFISTIFKIEYDKVEELYKDNQLCWLPTREEIPKVAGKRLSLTKLKNIDFSTVLPVLYTSLQKVAVGMELVFKNDNYKRFMNIQYQLKTLLCDFYTAFRETKVEMPANITREVVPRYYRTRGAETKIRDYIIFREYINTLEYTVEVFTNILQKYPTISFFKQQILS